MNAAGGPGVGPGSEINLPELEQAVLYTFQLAHVQQSGNPQQYAIRQQAEQMVDFVKNQHPQGWTLALNLLCGTNNEQVAFWCLQTLQSLLVSDERWAQLAEPQQAMLQKSYMDWVEQQLVESANGGSTNSPKVQSSGLSTAKFFARELYIRNKIALVVTLLIKRRYPEIWVTAFMDLVRMLNHGTAAISLFLLVLGFVDDEIVAYHVERQPAEIQHNTLIKDTMREGALGSIVEACYTILGTYRSVDVYLTRHCLKVLALLIGWVDLPLIVNDRLIPAFFHLLEDVNYRCASLQCLNHLLGKGMPAAKKLELVNTLGVIPALLIKVESMRAMRDAGQSEQAAHGGGSNGGGGAGSASGTPSTSANTSPTNALSSGAGGALVPDEASRRLFSGADALDDLHHDSFMEDVADAVVLIGAELMDGKENVGLTPQGQDALQRHWQLVVLCATERDIDVRLSVFKYVNSIVNLLKARVSNMIRSATDRVTEAGTKTQAHVTEAANVAALAAAASAGESALVVFVRSVLPTVIEMIAKNMAYPPDFAFLMDDEDEAEVEQFRRFLKGLYVNVVRCEPVSVVMPFLRRMVDAVFGPGQVPAASRPFYELEVVLKLIYAFGEGANTIISPLKQKTYKSSQVVELALDEHREAFGEIVALTMRGIGSAKHLHHSVALVFNELTSRYTPILQSYHRDLVKQALENLAGEGGVHHSSARVRSHSCYLLLRMCKSLGSCMDEYAHPVLLAIQDVLTIPTAACVEEEASATAARAGAAGGAGQARRASVKSTAKHSISDLLSMFELAGVLIAGNGMDASTRAKYLGAVMGSLVELIDSTMSQVEACDGNPSVALNFGGMSVGPEEFRQLSSRWVGSSIGALAALSKGFHGAVEEGVAVLFRSSLATVARALEVFPGQSMLRTKVVFFLHRMVECLGLSFLDSAPKFVTHLLQNAREAVDVVQALHILNQLVIRHRKEMSPCLDALFLPIVSRVQESVDVMNGSWGDVTDAGAFSYEQTEMVAHLRGLHSFIHNLVNHDVAHVLYSPTNLHAFPQVLLCLSTGMGLCVSPSVQRLCCQTIISLTKQWMLNLPPEAHGSVVSSATKQRMSRKNNIAEDSASVQSGGSGVASGSNSNGSSSVATGANGISGAAAAVAPVPPNVREAFEHFLAESATPMSFRATVQPTFDIENDAQSAQLLTQLCEFHLLMRDVFGQDWLHFVQNTVLVSNLHVDPPAATDYCEKLAVATKAKQLRAEYKRVFLVKPPQSS